MELLNVIENAPFGYSFNRICLSENSPVDFVCLYSNTVFKKIFGINEIDILNKKASQVTQITPLLNPSFLKVYHSVILNKSNEDFEFNSETIEKKYRIEVSSSSEDCFNCVFWEVPTEIESKGREELYSIIIKNLGEGVGIVDDNECFIFANATAEEIFEVPSGGLLGKSLEEFLSKEEYQKILEQTSKRKIGMKGTYEFILKRKSGELRNILITSNLQYDKSGKPIGTLGVFRDITERKRIEQNLFRSEQKLSQALSATLDAIWEWNYQTGETYYSSRWFEILGYDSNDLMMNYETWKQLCNPEDLDNCIRIINESIIVGKSDSYRIEFRMMHKNGVWKWILGRGKVISRAVNGEPLIISGTNTDISERKIVEEELIIREKRFRSIFDKTTEMVVLHEVIFDNENKPVDYRIIDANPAYTKITGIEREVICGKLGSEVYQSMPPPYFEEFSRVGLTGEPYEFNTYYQPMDKYFIISVVSPQENQFATITTDVTMVQQYNERLKQKNEELENYLYVASHDLRSPLVNIQGFSSRLKKQNEIIREILSKCDMELSEKSEILELLSAKIPMSFNYIFTNVAKMDSLINSLLQISRTGRVIMTIEKIDLNILIKKVINAFDFQLKEIDAGIAIDNLPDCYGDDTLLNQLFSNIISNAIKYRNKERNLKIKIKGRENFKKIIISVEDNGIGIATRHLKNIWDVFFRVKSDKEEPGEGIGLSIAKRIIDKHKGRIWVESVEGGGTTFFIELLRHSFNE